MNEDFARTAWADHHARLAADLSRGLAGLRRLLRRHASPSSLPGIDAPSASKPPRDQGVAAIVVDGRGLPEPTGRRTA